LIKELQIGDSVYCADDSLQIVTGTVSQISKTKKSCLQQTLFCAVCDDEIIITEPQQYFYQNLNNQRWVAAESLFANNAEYYFLQNNKDVEAFLGLSSKERVFISLEVLPYHNFFITKKNILVHNEFLGLTLNNLGKVAAVCSGVPGWLINIFTAGICLVFNEMVIKKEDENHKPQSQPSLKEEAPRAEIVIPKKQTSPVVGHRRVKQQPPPQDTDPQSSWKKLTAIGAISAYIFKTAIKCTQDSAVKLTLAMAYATASPRALIAFGGSVAQAAYRSIAQDKELLNTGLAALNASSLLNCAVKTKELAETSEYFLGSDKTTDDAFRQNQILEKKIDDILANNARLKDYFQKSIPKIQGVAKIFEDQQDISELNYQTLGAMFDHIFAQLTPQLVNDVTLTKEDLAQVKNDTTEIKLHQNENRKDLAEIKTMLQKIVPEKDYVIEQQRNLLADKDKTIQDKDKTIQDKDKTIEGKDKTIEGLLIAVEDKDKTIEGKDKTIQDKDKQLTKVQTQAEKLRSYLKSTGIDPDSI